MKKMIGVAGLLALVPDITNRVTLYLGSVTVEFQAWVAEGTMLIGVAADSVYELTWLGVKPFSASAAVTALAGSLLMTNSVIDVPAPFTAA